MGWSGLGAVGNSGFRGEVGFGVEKGYQIPSPVRTKIAHLSPNELTRYVSDCF